jgi:CDGSH iron-sulfur domain-containing protein 3
MSQTYDTTQPTIDDRTLNFLTLEPGIYHLCSCGLSANSPFCSVVDQGTDCNPVTFELTETKQVLVDSDCKHSQKAPFCNNIHAEHSQY